MGGATKRSGSAAGLATGYTDETNALMAGEGVVKKGKGGASKRKIVLTAKDKPAPVQQIAPKTDCLVEHSIPSSLPNSMPRDPSSFFCSSFVLENNPPPAFLNSEFPISSSFVNDPFPCLNQPDISGLIHHQQPVVTGLRSAAAGLASLCQETDMDYFDSYMMNGLLLATDWQRRTSRGSIPTMKIAPKQPVPIKQKPLSSLCTVTQTTSQLSLGEGSLSSVLGRQPCQDSSMSIIPCFSTHKYASSPPGTRFTRSTRLKDPKRAHHIASEHKRRFRIKNELNRLNDMVPGLMGCPKNSQAKVLQAAADYMEKVIQENARIRMEFAALKAQQKSDQV